MTFFRVAAVTPGPIFTEDFEAGALGWTHGGPGDNWELGLPLNGPGQAHSGTNVYATGLNSPVEAFADCYLRSPRINLPGVVSATLTFQEWRRLDSYLEWQYAVVNVLDADTFEVLQELSREAGETAGYQAHVITLPPSVLGRNVILEFLLHTDNFNLMEGWYIDDVQVTPW